MAIWLEEEQPLQTALVVGDVEIPINTSFRVWLRFQRLICEKQIADPHVLLSEPPEGVDWRQAAIEFCIDKQQVPRTTARASRAPVCDFEVDAEYLVAAFQQAYAIDLTDPALKLHWHRFMALFRSLPQEVLMSRMMGWRSWKAGDDKRKAEQVNRELRDAWALPLKGAESDEELIAMQESWFAGIEYQGGEA